MILQELILHYIECNEKAYRDVGKAIGVNHSLLHRFAHGRSIESNAMAKIIAWALKLKPAVKAKRPRRKSK